ncbi:hypothetical protein AB3331_09345 [Streptococcus sp. H49]|uniref:hypothetical protein n=1 Tax=Streptococcus huangxiaojuni TaxID=3237239 RepID=UPI0034A2B288
MVDAVELSLGILGLRKVYFQMDHEDGVLIRDDLHRTVGHIDIPEEYLTEATEVVKEYNNKLRDLALQIIEENL